MLSFFLGMAAMYLIAAGVDLYRSFVNWQFYWPLDRFPFWMHFGWSLIWWKEI